MNVSRFRHTAPRTPTHTHTHAHTLTHSHTYTQSSDFLAVAVLGAEQGARGDVCADARVGGEALGCRAEGVSGGGGGNGGQVGGDAGTGGVSGVVMGLVLMWCVLDVAR